MPHLAAPSVLQPAGRANARSSDPAERHRTAVASSVASAHECAARGDYADALSWVAVLDAIGELPFDLEAVRPAWLRSHSPQGHDGSTRREARADVDPV